VKDKRLRVSLVICLFGPEELSSGAVRIVYDTARYLSERGHSVSIFSGIRNKDNSLRRKSLDGIDWWFFGLGDSLRPEKIENYSNPLAGEYFIQFLENLKPDVVHFHALQGLGVTLIEEAKNQNIPTVLHVHDWWWFCPFLFLAKLDGNICDPLGIPKACDCLSHQFLKDRFFYIVPFFQLVDRVVFVSDFIKNSYKSIMMGLYELNNAVVIENPVVAVEQRLVKKSPVLRFTYLGGLNPHKGYYLLRNAVMNLQGQFLIRYYGCSFGEVNWLKKVFDWIRRGLRPSKEKFLPRYEHSDLPDIFALSDVVVVPSLILESYNLVVREALSAGVPVIASKSGGPESVVVDGKNGWLFPRGDEVSLRKIMQNLIDNPEEVLRAKNFIKENPVMLKRWAEYIEELESLYIDLVEWSDDV